MANTPYQPTVRLIQNGEAVNQAVTNRPIQDLSQRTASLKEEVDGALIGESLFARSVTVETASAVGNAVYRDNNGVYQRGLSGIAWDTNGVTVGVAETAFVQGVIQYKHNSTTADIVTYGTMYMSDTVLAAACADGLVHTGQLFLSSVTPGKLTHVRPPIGVPVCYVSGPDAASLYHVFVNPAPRDLLESHVHYKVDLYCLPAGTGGTSGGRAVVNSPDANLVGWLPASHASFNGHAPAHAKFGYNIAKDDRLNTIWPPIPTGAAYLEKNGIGLRSSGIVPQVIMDNYGIWWIDDCAGDQPWPIPYPESGELSSSSSLCPYPVEFQLTLWFSRLRFKTSESVVTSLRAANNTITITNLRNASATTGDLQVAVNLSLTTTDSTPGSLAVKTVNGLALNRGLILEGIKSLNPSVLPITGGTALTDDATFQGGRVTIDFVDPFGSREGYLDLIQFNDALLSDHDDTLYFELPYGIQSSLRGRLRIPTVGITTGSTLQLFFTVLATSAGTLPSNELTVAFRKIPADSDGCTPQSLPSADASPATVDFSCSTAISAWNYMRVAGPTLSVNPGDLVCFTLNRPATSSYVHAIGFIDSYWKVTP